MDMIIMDITVNFNNRFISVQRDEGRLVCRQNCSECRKRKKGSRRDRCGNNVRGRATRAARSCSPLLPRL